MLFYVFFKEVHMKARPMIPLSQQTESTNGLIYAVLCYLIWGLFPLYWMPLLGMMSTEQMMAQRVVWTALFCVFLVISLKQYAPILAVLKKPRTLLIIMLTGSILSANWLIYLYAISIHEVLQSSLGYFMSPLITLLLGRIFFNEKLTQVKTIAVSLVGLGVLWLIFLYGDIPWLSLGISATFGVYALLRKLAPLAALPGLTVETLTMLPFALVYLVYVQQNGELIFWQLDTFQLLILLGTGVITTVPLLLFAAGAKRISLANMGMIQYISPTIQFLLGLFVFHEAFDMNRFIGFVWVWLGIAVFVWGSRRSKA